MDTKYTLRDIKLQTSIPYISVESITITTEMGSHGILEAILQIDDSLECARAESYKDSEISLSIKDEGIIFTGKCEKVLFSVYGDNQTAHITAYSMSYITDQNKINRTFQNPSKTLMEVVSGVFSEYGVDAQTDNDVALPNVISAENETAYSFVKRIAAEQGMTLFTDATLKKPTIFIGKVGFRNYTEDDLGESKSVSRDNGEYAKSIGAGKDTAEYMFDSTVCDCKKLAASAGCKIGQYKVIKKSVVSNIKGCMTNEISYSYVEGIRPTTEESDAPGFKRSVLTGTVMAVAGNEIQVQLDNDGLAGGMVWVPYESAISNSFYCMPDEGDTVFLYYENNGKIVCLGSKHASADGPDFTKPTEKVLTNHDKMVKLGDKQITFTATRELHDDENPNEISFYMNDDSGITVQSGMDIRIEAAETINLFAGNVTDADASSDTGHERLKARYDAGLNTYLAESGDVSALQIMGSMLQDSAYAVGKNFVDTAKGMLMVDMFSTIFGGGENGEDSQNEEPVTPVENGVLTLYGYEVLSMMVGNSQLLMGEGGIEFNTDSFKWLGYTQLSHAKEEIPFQDWWEVALDGLQMALDIAGMIPGVGCFFDLASGVISLARGDFMGAALSLVSAIPGVGDAVGAAKIAGKGIAIATKVLSKAERIIRVLQGIYMMAQGLWGLYRSKDALKQLWEDFKEGGFAAIANPEDISLLINTVQSTTMVLKGGKNVAEGMIGKSVTLCTKEEAERIKKENEAKAAKEKQKTDCGDPVNVVTGSFSLAYTDFALCDIKERFYIERHYESVYTNKGMLLGDKWFLNFETRLVIESDEKITVQLPDMKLLSFDKQGENWVNDKGEDRTYQLLEDKDCYKLRCNDSNDVYEYDLDGKIRFIYDSDNNKTVFNYVNGVLTSFQLSSGLTVCLDVQDGLLKKMTMDDGRCISYEYDKKLLTKITLPNMATISYEYNSAGYITAISDQNGHEYVRNKYDALGRVVWQQTSAGHDFTFFYDRPNKKTIFTENNTGEKTVFYYDANQLVNRIEYDDATFEEYKFDKWENKIYEKDRNGNEIFRTYDVFGKIIREQNAEGLITEREYNVDHKLVKETDNYGHEVLWEYDEKGHLVRERMLIDDGRYAEMSFGYDSYGHIIDYINPNGNKTHYKYNKFCEPEYLEKPSGYISSMNYDIMGRLLVETTPTGSREYGYNEIDCLTMERDEEENTTRYDYDKLGNQISIIKPNNIESWNKKIQISYTSLDEVEKIVTAEGNVYNYKYSNVGRIEKEIHPVAYLEQKEIGEKYDYDITGRIIRIHYPDGGIKRYFLDGNGNVIKAVMPKFYIAEEDDGDGYIFEYNTENQITKVTDPEGKVIGRYIYDIAGNLIKSIDALGYLAGENDETRVGTVYTYNKADWITSVREPLEKDENGNVKYKLTEYLYDDMGQKLSEIRYIDGQTIDSASGKCHTINYEYDAGNRLVKVSDTLGAAIKYAYDKNDNMVQEKVRVNELEWRETRYCYTKSGRLSGKYVRVKSAEENDRLQLDMENIMCDTNLSLYAKTEYEYDNNGNIIRVLNPEGGILEYEYDADDRLIKEHHYDANEIDNIIEYTYDAASNVVAVKDANNNTTRYVYDYMDHNIEIHQPDGGVIKNIFDKNGNISEVLNPELMKALSSNNKADIAGIEKLLAKNRFSQRYVYDKCDRIINVIGPDGIVNSAITYDNAGNIIKNADTVGSGVSIEYDLAGRRKSIVTGGGVKSEYYYDALGNNVGILSGENNKTQFITDVWGRITGVVRPDGGEEHFEYDYMGNMLKSTDAAGNIVTYEADVHGNMISRVDSKGERETFGYDKENRMILHTDRNGNRVNISYNMYGSIRERRAINENSIVQVTEKYGYAGDGKLKYAITGGMRYDYEYDCMNRIKRKSAGTRTLLENTYDLNGNRIALKDASGKETSYTYDAYNRIASISDNGKQLLTYKYNADGMIDTMEMGSIVTEYKYDIDKNIISQKTYVKDFEAGVLSKEAGKLSNINDIHNIRDFSLGNKYGKSGIIEETSFSYNSIGKLVSKSTLGGLTEYTYDNLDRLTKVKTPKETQEYTYDIVGNRLEKLIKNNGVISKKEAYVYDSRNHLVERKIYEITDGREEERRKESYTYDNQGNLSSVIGVVESGKSDQNEYVYDTLNRLTEVKRDKKTVQRNVYDAEGLRAEMEENGKLIRFIFDDGEVICEEDETKVVRRTIRGYEPVSSECENTRMYYHLVSDNLGSITDVTDECGRVLNHYEYDAFGEYTVREEQVENRFGFAGEQFDPAINMYYLRARFYNPVIGRFIQEDTYYGDGLNLYAYCHNNPVEFVDPSGHEGICDEKYQELKKKSKLTDAEKEQIAEYERRNGIRRKKSDKSRANPSRAGYGATSKMKRATPLWRKLYGPRVLREHHLIPQIFKNNQQFINRLMKLGIKDVDAYIDKRIALITNSLHIDIHIDGWNNDWTQWLNKNPQFQLKDLNDQINLMMKKYNIPKSSRDTRPYGYKQTARK